MTAGPRECEQYGLLFGTGLFEIDGFGTSQCQRAGLVEKGTVYFGQPLQRATIFHQYPCAH